MNKATTVQHPLKWTLWGQIGAFSIFLTMMAPPASGAQDWAFIEQVIIAEAANQGEVGIYAVACVLRNRGYNLKGFSATRRSDLRAFTLRQPAKVQRWAAHAIVQVRRGDPDITMGATNYENVDAFGTPWWAKDMTIVAVIGDHTFYR